MNIWSRVPVTENPYTRTAFSVARVPRHVTNRRTLLQTINTAMDIARNNPEMRAIAGKPVTAAEVNWADSILSCVEERMIEELLTHAVERPPVQRIRQLATEAAAAMNSMASQPLSLTNPRALEPVLTDLVCEWLDTMDADSVMFGAMELDPVPPFGGDEWI